MNCYFCKQENIGRTHHCPGDDNLFKDFRIYNRALSVKEVQALYRSRMHPYKFTIWAIAIIGLAVVIVRWLV